MLKKIITFWLVVWLAAFAAGCGSSHEAQEAEWYRFTDSTGTSVVLQEQPKKVAVLFSSFADVWVTAGGEIAVTVGEAVERGFAPEDVILVDEGAGKKINSEVLLAAEPDLCICSADVQAQVEAAEVLRGAGIPCALFRVEAFSEYLNLLKICTDITGKSENYVTYGEKPGARIQELLAQVPKDNASPQVLFIRSGNSASSAKAKTAAEHFGAAMVQELGGHNIAEDVPVLLDGLSVEEILLRDPDVILITTMGKEAAAKEYMDSVLATDAWQSLMAVQEGRCYYLPKELFQFKPNARWDEAYLYLARLLFPEMEWE